MRLPVLNEIPVETDIRHTELTFYNQVSPYYAHKSSNASLNPSDMLHSNKPHLNLRKVFALSSRNRLTNCHRRIRLSTRQPLAEHAGLIGPSTPMHASHLASLSLSSSQTRESYHLACRMLPCRPLTTHLTCLPHTFHRTYKEKNPNAIASHGQGTHISRLCMD